MELLYDYQIRRSGRSMITFFISNTFTLAVSFIKLSEFIKKLTFFIMGQNKQGIPISGMPCQKSD